MAVAVVSGLVAGVALPGVPAAVASPTVHRATAVATTVPKVKFDVSVQFPYSGPIGLKLSSVSPVTVTVRFRTSDGPEAGLYEREWIGDAGDVRPRSGTVTFSPGQTHATIAFRTIDPNATGCSISIPPTSCWPSITVTLSNPSGAILGAKSAMDVYFED